MKLYVLYIDASSGKTAKILVNRKPGAGYSDMEVYKPIPSRIVIEEIFLESDRKWTIEH
jgi:hypothetical protein